MCLLRVTAAAAEEPHLFFGLHIAAMGISLVHTASEELLYLSGRQFTVDFVKSERTATFEAQLISFQIDNQQASGSALHTRSIVCSHYGAPNIASF